MSESPNAAGLSAADAAAMLLWLRDMGADEALASAPVNRFAEAPALPAPDANAPAVVKAAPPARHSTALSHHAPRAGA
jgi:hypothetical protein